MLTYNLSGRGKAPLYFYLYQCIRQDIIGGQLKPGEALPSKRALAQHLQVGVITVANAYAQLVTEGFVRAEEKRGYFVTDVRHYMQKKPRAAVPDVAEEQEKEHFLNLKANRISLQNFPAATWNSLMREALSLSTDTLFKTIPYKGLYELRSAIAGYLRENRGMEVSPSQIIIGAGTEYLYDRLMQMFGRACTFAIEDPGYKKFGAISAGFGNPWRYVPIDESGIMIDKLEESGADVVHLSPANHFPTGIVMPVTRRIELFEWVNRASKRYIIEDDYDSEFRYSVHYIPPLFAEDTQNKVIYLNTFSKTLVPSLRISYMVLPPRLLRRYEETMSFYACTTSGFEQYALARFISRGHFERHLNRMKNYYREQRRLILSAFRHSSLAACSRILERNAGTHFLLQVDTALSRDEVRQRAKAQDIVLSFLEEYRSAPVPDEPLTLVVNYAGVEREKITELVLRFETIFAK